MRDQILVQQAQKAVDSLMRSYGFGAYRLIRDPEGVISLWAIEGTARTPFSIVFVDKGRSYRRVEELPDDYLRTFLTFVGTSVP